MKMFMLKAIMLAAVMFISVLYGMQQANEGIHDMKGYEDDGFKGAFSFQESNKGELQAAILGEDVSSHDIEKKKEQLEEMKAYNFFSSLGKSLAEIVSAITEKTIDFITGLVKGD